LELGARPVRYIGPSFEALFGPFIPKSFPTSFCGRILNLYADAALSSAVDATAISANESWRCIYAWIHTAKFFQAG